MKHRHILYIQKRMPDKLIKIFYKNIVHNVEGPSHMRTFLASAGGFSAEAATLRAECPVFSCCHSIVSSPFLCLYLANCSPISTQKHRSYLKGNERVCFGAKYE